MATELLQIKRGYDKWHLREQSLKAVGIVDRHFYKWLLKALARRGDAKLLDIGCGEGGWLEICERNGIEAYGVDISRVAILKTQSHLRNPRLAVAVGENLPFQSDSFDIVSCLGSLEHFSDQMSGVVEIARVLDPNGTAFIFLPNAYFLGHVYLVYKTGGPLDEGGQQFAERFATKEAWRKLIESAGLKVVGCLKYNRITKASTRVSAPTRILYNLLIAPFMPTNLSYCFLFVCRRA